MTDDIVKELRNSGWYLAKPAADSIEKLEADLEVATMKRLLDSNRIEKLEAALREIADCFTLPAQNDCEMRQIARKALEEKDD